MTQAFEDLKAIRIRGMWRFLKTQPASFWLVCTYLLLEYVRPQIIYPSLDVIPWGNTVMILTVAAFLFEGRVPKPRTIGGGLILAFGGVILASSVFAYRPDIAFSELPVFFSWLLVFLLITNSVTTQERFFFFMLLFLLFSFKMSQHATRSWAVIGFGYRDWGVTGAPGWFANAGEFGIQMCVFIPLSIAFIAGLKQRWSRWKLAFFVLFPVTAGMGIIASSSRGAMLGGAAVLFWWLVQSRRFRTLLAVVVFASAAYWITPEEQLARFDTIGEDATSERRETRWADGIEMMKDNPVFGIGYGNWEVYYRDHYPQRKDHGLSHNIFVQAGSELGFVGLIAFALLILATFQLNRRTRRMVRGQDRFLHAMAYGLDGALVGYLTSGFFVTVLYYPYFWINLAMTVSLNVVARNRVAAIRQSHHHGQVGGERRALGGGLGGSTRQQRRSLAFFRGGGA